MSSTQSPARCPCGGDLEPGLVLDRAHGATPRNDAWDADEPTTVLNLGETDLAIEKTGTTNAAPGDNLVNQTFFVEGYPGDHPAQMWWDGDVVNQQSATRMFYSIDTAPGQSGSPVYHLNSVTPGLCGGWCVTGIHTYGPFDTVYNSGTRFTADVMSFINYWISQP